MRPEQEHDVFRPTDHCALMQLHDVILSHKRLTGFRVILDRRQWNRKAKKMSEKFNIIRFEYSKLRHVGDNLQDLKYIIPLLPLELLVKEDNFDDDTNTVIIIITQ